VPDAASGRREDNREVACENRCEEEFGDGCEDECGAGCEDGFEYGREDFEGRLSWGRNGARLPALIRGARGEGTPGDRVARGCVR